MESKIKPIEFGDVYHKRWEIEEHYKAAKGFISIEFFHSKSLHGVLQEIYTAELLLTLSRLVAIETESIQLIQRAPQKKSAVSCESSGGSDIQQTESQRANIKENQHFKKHVIKNELIKNTINNSESLALETLPNTKESIKIGHPISRKYKAKIMANI